MEFNNNNNNNDDDDEDIVVDDIPDDKETSKKLYWPIFKRHDDGDASKPTDKIDDCSNVNNVPAAEDKQPVVAAASQVAADASGINNPDDDGEQGRVTQEEEQEDEVPIVLHLDTDYEEEEGLIVVSEGPPAAAEQTDRYDGQLLMDIDFDDYFEADDCTMRDPERSDCNLKMIKLGEPAMVLNTDKLYKDLNFGCYVKLEQQQPRVKRQLRSNSRIV